MLLAPQKNLPQQPAHDSRSNGCHFNFIEYKRSPTGSAACKILKKIIAGKFGQEWVMQLWQWHFIEFSTVAHCHPAQLIALVCPRRYLTQP